MTVCALFTPQSQQSRLKKKKKKKEENAKRRRGKRKTQFPNAHTDILVNFASFINLIYIYIYIYFLGFN